MARRRPPLRSLFAWITAASILVAPGGVLGAWMQAVGMSSSSGSSASVDDWPRRYVGADGGVLTVYEPQVSTWDEQKLLTLHAAVAYAAPGSSMPVLGTVTAEADSRVSVSERLVDFSSFRIVRSNFPQASREQAAAVVSAIKSNMHVTERVLALDRVLAYLDASAIAPKNVSDVKADPPVIRFSTRPAVMVNIDGAPIWSPIASNDLRFAVNTNWDLFEHPPTKSFYLRHDRRWMKAGDVMGPWAATATLPASFGKLPADDNWTDVRATLPVQALSGAAPTVFVSTSPAELILLRGEPQHEGVPGTKLLWVKNTESDVFRLGSSGPIYYLVAGRWFSAPGFDGPWAFATPNLPDDFAKIPIEHERSRVLASVPGTPQAAEAVLLAQIPQTARVSKKSLKAPEVVYQGDPQFDPIAVTTVARAANTDKDILKVGDLYYLCFQGVWFVSRSPQGPWEVTGSVPSEIYEIPVSSPSHHVTYVTVEDDDDEWVVYATAAAYTGLMVAWGCAVWGSGWYYPPYIGYGGFYPAYFPHYPTYGYSAWYNPWNGTYGRGAAVYGPYGGAGVGARYNPRTGTYARGAAAYGPYGARGVANAYNPRTGTYAATRQGSSVYGSWGTTGVQRGDQWATTSRVTNRATGTTTRATRTSGGGAAVTRSGPQGGGVVGTSGGGDVYAGRDGNVYRRDGDSWQRYENGSWSGVERATPQQQTQQRSADSSTVGQLNRDSAARQEGGQRTRDAATVNSGGAGARSGSYRPSGGGRAGGRRR